MASLRDRITEAYVARVDALTGWAASRRNLLNAKTSADAKVAFVFIERETKSLQNNRLYGGRLTIAFAIRCNPEDADETLHEDNVYRLLDEAVTDVEKVIHNAPVDLGIPGTGQVEVEGHDKFSPDERHYVIARLRVAVEYRHDIDNPDAYLGVS